MFHKALKGEEVEKINKLRSVKSMLTQIAEQIEERGMQQGARQNTLETARKMKEKGFSINDIVEITGLEVQEIEKLQ